MDLIFSSSPTQLPHYALSLRLCPMLSCRGIGHVDKLQSVIYPSTFSKILEAVPSRCSVQDALIGQAYIHWALICI